MATDPKNDDDHFSSAADEPTAMWTEDMVRDAQQGPQPVAAAPAPQPAAALAAGSTSHPPLRSGTRRRPPVPAEREPASMSWALTIALAIALGTAVYYFVRYLRG